MPFGDPHRDAVMTPLQHTPFVAEARAAEQKWREAKYTTDHPGMEVLPGGGRQHKSPYWGDLKRLAPVHLRVSNVLCEGKTTHKEGNWTQIPMETHLERAVTHIMLHLKGDRSEPHLVHANCRLQFAAAIHLNHEDGEPLDGPAVE